MSLVDYAKKELSLLDNDKDFNDSIIKAVKAFASYGHSGGSAEVGIEILHDLLRFKPLSPLTDNPEEWMEITDGGWQCTRNPEAFSNDHGKTYYLLSEGGSDKNPNPKHKTEKAK